MLDIRGKRRTCPVDLKGEKHRSGKQDQAARKHALFTDVSFVMSYGKLDYKGQRVSLMLELRADGVGFKGARLRL